MKRTVVILVIVLLIAAAINVPLAVWFTCPQRLRFGKTILNEIGPNAARNTWPDVTPHVQPWPRIHQWQVEGEFGHRRYTPWAVSEQQATTHQMQTDLYGWPLPVLSETNRYWPWDDPAWKIAAHQETGLRLVWAGLLLNPLMAALAVWLVFLAPPMIVRAIVRRRRLRRSQCPACGYPMGVSERCTECGAVLPTRAGAGST